MKILEKIERCTEEEKNSFYRKDFLLSGNAVLYKLNYLEDKKKLLNSFLETYLYIDSIFLKYFNEYKYTNYSNIDLSVSSNFITIKYLDDIDSSKKYSIDLTDEECSKWADIILDEYIFDNVNSNFMSDKKKNFLKNKINNFDEMLNKYNCLCNANLYSKKMYILFYNKQ